MPTAKASKVAIAVASFVAPMLVLSSFVSFAACSGDPKLAPAPLILKDDDAAKPDSAPPDPPDGALPPPPDSGIRGTIFTQTGRALQLYDPYSKLLRPVGPFSCLPQDDFMLDIAVDRDSNIFGATALDRFVKIDPLSGTCTVVRQGSGVEYPVLLAFVPRGTLDPANDALVGYDDETYLRIDVRTGAVTKVGTLNPPDASAPYSASGDLIFAGANGMFLTATVPGTPADAGDAFVRFDPKTGRRVSFVGSTGYDNLFGLGYWGGRIFAFTTPGEILQIDPRTAKATLVKRIDGGPVRDGAPSDPVFYGAGSTTVAPETPTP